MGGLKEVGEQGELRIQSTVQARKCHPGLLAVPRIFCLGERGGGGGGGGTNSAQPHRDLPYTDRVSSWTFCFHPYTESCL